MNFLFAFVLILAVFGDMTTDLALLQTRRGRQLSKAWTKCQQGAYTKAICLQTELLISKLIKLRKMQ